MTLTGVFAPVPTPFDNRGELDVRRLRRALARWVDSPLAGFVVLGSNGEAVLVDEEEAARVIGAAREAVPRGRPLIAGTGRESTRATIAACRRAASLGADAVIVRTPGFYRSQMSSDRFVAHYRAVADESPVPVLLYNFSAVTGVDLAPDAVSHLAPHPNIAGMKESNADAVKIATLVAAAPPPFAVLAGSSATFHAALLAGASGGVLALGCLLPHACSNLFALARSSDREHAAEARALQERIAPLARLIGSAHGVAGLKAALNLAGYDVGVPRAPLVPLPESARAALGEALDAFDEARPGTPIS